MWTVFIRQDHSRSSHPDLERPAGWQSKKTPGKREKLVLGYVHVWEQRWSRSQMGKRRGLSGSWSVLYEISFIRSFLYFGSLYCISQYVYYFCVLYCFKVPILSIKSNQNKFYLYGPKSQLSPEHYFVQWIFCKQQLRKKMRAFLNIDSRY